MLHKSLDVSSHREFTVIRHMQTSEVKYLLECSCQRATKRTHLVVWHGPRTSCSEVSRQGNGFLSGFTHDVLDIAVDRVDPLSHVTP